MYETEPKMKYQKEEVWYPLAFDIWHWERDCHVLMLNDKIRMNAYEKAIKEVVKPGMTVLDIGTGTGNLALWALEAGALKVYAIDINKEIILEANVRIKNAGFIDKFESFNALSYDVTLPEKVDVIMSEILGNLADNQEMTPILEDARQRFLKPNGVFIPSKVETFLVPVSSTAIHNQIKNGIFKNLNDNYSLDELMIRFGVKNCFNMPFNVIIPKSTYLSEPIAVKEFNFNGSDESVYKVPVIYKISKSGLLTGFKGYFIAKLSPNSVLDISSDDIEKRKTSDCWKHLYLPIETPFELERDDELHLTYQRFYPVNHNRNFMQGYRWSGLIKRSGKVVYEFSQSLGM